MPTNLPKSPPHTPPANPPENPLVPLRHTAGRLLRANPVLNRFGLALTPAQALEVAHTQRRALQDTGRVELWQPVAQSIPEKLAVAFCDSPFTSPGEFPGLLCRLVEIFYAARSELQNACTDDALVARMANAFNGPCQGSPDLLEGKALDHWIRTARPQKTIWSVWGPRPGAGSGPGGPTAIPATNVVSQNSPLLSLDAAFLAQNEEDTVEFLLQNAAALGLSAASAAAFRQGLLAFTNRRLLRYAADETASLCRDEAAELAQSVLYTVGVALKTCPGAGQAAALLCHAPVEELWQRGRAQIDKMLQSAKHLRRAAQSLGLKTPNHGYNATLGAGIAAFLQNYQPDYAAHQCPVFLDYPLCLEVAGGGAALLLRYTAHLLQETRFLCRFAPRQLHGVLLRAFGDYRDAPENLFAPALEAALGCALDNWPLSELAGGRPGALGVALARCKTPAEAKALCQTAANALGEALALPHTDSLFTYIQTAAAQSLALAAVVQRVP